MGIESIGDYIGVGFICAMFYGFIVFVVHAHVIGGTIGHNWTPLLPMPIRTILLLLAPLTLVLSLLCWIFSGGGDFGNWLYAKLRNHAYRKARPVGTWTDCHQY